MSNEVTKSSEQDHGRKAAQPSVKPDSSPRHLAHVKCANPFAPESAHATEEPLG